MKKRSASKKPLRFAAVGIANTLVDIGVYSLLTVFGWPVLIANTISTSCGMLLSFFLNRSFTFDAKQHSVRRQVVPFLAVTLTSQWILQPIMIIIGKKILLLLGINGAILILLPKLGGIAVSLVWNYILYNKFVFKSSAADSNKA